VRPNYSINHSPYCGNNWMCVFSLLLDFIRSHEQHQGAESTPASASLTSFFRLINLALPSAVDDIEAQARD
jgi:hypothetical protein